MASKWDDGDDVVRPSVQSPKDVRGEVSDWQAKMKADAAKAAQDRALDAATAPPSAPSQRAMAPQAAATLTKTQKKAPPPPSDAVIKRLEEQARSSAEDAVKRTKKLASKRVRLRVRVSGWYEGSVPAVDFMDGRPHFFPHAPSTALDTEEHYLEYWRKPFIVRFKELGFEVVEEDL